MVEQEALNTEPSDDTAGNTEAVELTPREKRLAAMSSMQDGGATQDELFKACQCENKGQLNTVFAHLMHGDMYPVEQDGRYVLLDYEKYQEFVDSNVGVTAATKGPKKDLNNLQARRSRLINACVVKSKVLASATKAYEKDNTSTVPRIKFQMAVLGKDLAYTLYDEFRAKAARDLGLENVAEVDAITDLDHYIEENQIS